MDPERWQLLRRIFEAALDRGPAQRGAFLEEACGSDVALRREVETLLAGCDEDDDFLEKPACLEVPELLRASADVVSSGFAWGRTP